MGEQKARSPPHAYLIRLVDPINKEGMNGWYVTNNYKLTHLKERALSLDYDTAVQLAVRWTSQETDGSSYDVVPDDRKFTCFDKSSLN